jgi:hypothetical protein
VKEISEGIYKSKNLLKKNRGRETTLLCMKKSMGRTYKEVLLNGF